MEFVKQSLPVLDENSGAIQVSTRYLLTPYSPDSIPTYTAHTSFGKNPSRHHTTAAQNPITSHVNNLNPPQINAFPALSPLIANQSAPHSSSETRSAMHDDTARNFSDEQPTESNRPHRSTGPTSPEGKAKSSMNRLTHGCRSQRTVLPFEDEEEWEFTLQSWMNSYNPQAHRSGGTQAIRPGSGHCAHLDEDPTAATLVFETARAQWIFQRNQQRLDETESGLPPDAIEWTEDHIKRYNNFLRYKTTAERSFYRAFNNLEAHYKRQAGKAAAAERARAQMAKIQMHWLKNKAEAAAEKLRQVQLVEVTANSRGECVTTFVPANELVISLASKAEEPPAFVSRFVSFTAGVPPAYDWLNPNHIQAHEPVIGVQLFTWSDWLQQIEAEKVAATGDLQPYATNLLLNV